VGDTTSMLTVGVSGQYVMALLTPRINLPQTPLYIGCTSRYFLWKYWIFSIYTIFMEFFYCF